MIDTFLRLLRFFAANPLPPRSLPALHLVRRSLGEGGSFGDGGRSLR
jgi:hypothetical protein